uniref:Uncharacterized protein n=1 Tax=Cucumis melo TaxID=3656 RepID=A0A9I9ED71_CUCME
MVFRVLSEVSITLFLVAYNGRIVPKKSNTFRVKCGTWNSCEVKGFEGQIGMEISSIQSRSERTRRASTRESLTQMDEFSSEKSWPLETSYKLFIICES